MDFIVFKDLFNFTYERNIEEAAFFYFFYVIFGYYITGAVYSIIKFCPLPHNYCYFLMVFVPFVFYTFVAANIYSKKKLTDKVSFYLLSSTIIINLALAIVNLPIGLLTLLIIPKGLVASLMIGIFVQLVIGCVPVTLLTAQEDYSLKDVVYEMEKERLYKVREIERQLLKERIMAKNAQKSELEIVHF